MNFVSELKQLISDKTIFNQRLNIKAFFDKVITNPFISTTYPGAITNAGISLRFTIPTTHILLSKFRFFV